MPEAEPFSRVCAELERLTEFSRIEARGTVRIALKKAGLAADSVTSEQLQVVIEKLLPDELETRGVPGIPALCESLQRGLDGATSNSDHPTPEEVFSRLGGS